MVYRVMCMALSFFGRTNYYSKTVNSQISRIATRSQNIAKFLIVKKPRPESWVGLFLLCNFYLRELYRLPMQVGVDFQTVDIDVVQLKE